MLVEVITISISVNSPANHGRPEPDRVDPGPPHRHCWETSPNRSRFGGQVGTQGFDFLGYSIRAIHGKRDGRCKVILRPSRRSIRRFRDNVRRLFARRGYDLHPLFWALNAYLRGWGQYFAAGVSKWIFNALVAAVLRRVKPQWHAVTPVISAITTPVRRRGRPKKEAVPATMVHYRAGWTVTPPSAAAIQQERERRSTFVLVSSQLTLSARTALQEYNTRIPMDQGSDPLGCVFCT